MIQCATLDCRADAITVTVGLPSCGPCAELPTCEAECCETAVLTKGLCGVCQEIEDDTL